MNKNEVIGPDRIALVTGGSSGIGLALARLLAQKGSHVWLVARQQDRLASALEEVKAARQSARQHCGAISADVSDPAQAVAAAEQVAREAGSPHLLVNSAGVARPGYFQELDLEAFRWMMDINYFGAVHMVKAVAPKMMKRGSGHIVNISSVAGFLGIYGYSAYGASKFAVTGLSDVLRAELKPHGIRVSIVFPPDVDTPQLAYEKPFRPAETRLLVDGGPILSPEAVAAAILRGVSRNRYIIIPGATSKALYWLMHALGSAAYPVMDWFVARARRQASKNRRAS
ncbi:MAG TPA: SDR family oxidoreductase [Anaerolineales bacterium]|nr:SDR family oxidoreductase [Anaerolineales bacterium]